MGGVQVMEVKLKRRKCAHCENEFVATDNIVYDTDYAEGKPVHRTCYDLMAKLKPLGKVEGIPEEASEDKYRSIAIARTRDCQEAESRLYEALEKIRRKDDRIRQMVAAVESAEKEWEIPVCALLESPMKTESLVPKCYGCRTPPNDRRWLDLQTEEFFCEDCVSVRSFP